VARVVRPLPRADVVRSISSGQCGPCVVGYAHLDGQSAVAWMRCAGPRLSPATTTVDGSWSGLHGLATHAPVTSRKPVLAGRWQWAHEHSFKHDEVETASWSG